MRVRLIADLARVFAFVGPRSGEQWSSGMKGIGLERDGEIVAGALYERWNGVNVWMHVAVAPGAHAIGRRFARYVFAYPFDELRCKRITGWVEESNAGALRLAEHAGFRREHRLDGAASDGGAVILLVMRRDDCRPLRDASMASCLD